MKAFNDTKKILVMPPQVISVSILTGDTVLLPKKIGNYITINNIKYI